MPFLTRYLAAVIAAGPLLGGAASAQPVAVSGPTADSASRGPLIAGVVTVGSLVEAIRITGEQPIQYFGLGHFIQKDWATGAAYLISETALLRLRRSNYDRVGPPDYSRFPSFSTDLAYSGANGLGPESHFRLQVGSSIDLIANDLRMADLFSAYRRLHLRTSATNKVQLSRESTGALALSPFKPKYLSQPSVYLPILLAGVVGVVVSDGSRPLSSAREVTMLNATTSPSVALRRLGAVQAIRYTAVAAGEEMFFRGVLQTELTERFSPRVALGASAVLFGAWHVPHNGLGGGAAATIAGLYLGKLYQDSQHDLGKAIALHFWWDWLPTMIEFARNPRQSQFVYGITW